jgi:hypothetical protein
LVVFVVGVVEPLVPVPGVEPVPVEGVVLVFVGEEVVGPAFPAPSGALPVVVSCPIYAVFKAESALITC